MQRSSNFQVSIWQNTSKNSQYLKCKIVVGSISFFGDHVLLMSLSKTLKTYAFLDFAFNKKNAAPTCQILRQLVKFSV